MDIKQRVLDYCKAKNIALSKFEKLSGLSNGYFNQVKKSPSDGKIESINRAFPDLNTEWLMTGEGEMLKNGNPVPIDFGSSSTDQSDQLFHTVPLVPTSRSRKAVLHRSRIFSYYAGNAIWKSLIK